MPIEKVYLDPNAQSYTDDEIVGKVNTAGAKISRAAAVDEAALPAESTTFQKVSEEETTKLSGIAEGAEVNPADLAALDAAQNTKLNGIDEGAKDDQTGAEVRDALKGVPDLERDFILSRPAIGQKKVVAVQTHSDGKQEIEQNDTAES